MKLKDISPWKKSYDKPREHIKRQRYHFVDNVQYNQSSVFSSSHEWMWELDHKEGWATKNRCFQTVVLEKTLQSPLDCKEIKSVNTKGNQSWIFIGKTDADAEAPIFRLLDAKNWLLEKTLNMEQQTSSNCCFLICIQISQEAGQMVWYSHLLKNFPVCCDPHSQRLWHSQ